MNIYFVRHGISNDHLNFRSQSQKSEVSQEGKKQIAILAKSLAKTPIDLIISSSCIRAIQSAEILNKQLNSPLIVNKHIFELTKNPTLQGIDRLDPLNLEYQKEKINSLTNLDWRFMNRGESLRDVINRAILFKNYLTSNYLEENILVVSHGIFISCFIAVTKTGENYRDGVFRKKFDEINLDYGSLSLIRYLESVKQWKTVFINKV